MGRHVLQGGQAGTQPVPTPGTLFLRYLLPVLQCHQCQHLVPQVSPGGHSHGQDGG